MKNFIKNLLTKDVFYLFLLALVGILVYYPSLNNQLIDLWDDGWVVKNQYTEGGFTFTNLLSILVEFYHGQYAPFNEYFYLLLYSISGGYHPFIFHLASLLLHIANTILVFYVIKELLLMSNRIEIKDVNILISVPVLGMIPIP